MVVYNLAHSSEVGQIDKGIDPLATMQDPEKSDGADVLQMDCGASGGSLESEVHGSTDDKVGDGPHSKQTAGLETIDIEIQQTMQADPGHRTSGRTRHLNEKSQEYPNDLYNRNFRHAAKKFCVEINKAANALIDCRECHTSYDQDATRRRLCPADHRVQEVDSIFFHEHDAHQLYDGITSLYYKTVDELRSGIRTLEGDALSSHSVIGRASRRSNASDSCNLKAEAAALRTQMKFIELEALKKAELQQLETLRKLAMTQVKLEVKTQEADLPEENVKKEEYVSMYLSSMSVSEQPGVLIPAYDVPADSAKARMIYETARSSGSSSRQPAGVKLFPGRQVTDVEAVTQHEGVKQFPRSPVE